MKITKAQANKVLTALKRQQRSAIKAGATPPVLTYDEGFPLILWEEGPYEWTYLFPHGGTDAEFGFKVEPVELPAGVFAEPQTTYSMGLFNI